MRVGADVRAATEHHLRYARPLGIDAETAKPAKPVLEITAREREDAAGTLLRAGVDGKGPRVGVHPGGKWTVKRWPTAGFAALVRLLRDRLDAHVVVFTGPGEEAHTEALRGVADAGVTILEAMPVRAVAALVSELDGMVACDGGIMHVSVAVGTPTVGIFGSAEPEVWFPYEGYGPYRASYLPMVCRPCHRHECPLGHTHCLVELDPERVFADLETVLTRERSV
jgi:heptosyltransferase-2